MFLLYSILFGECGCRACGGNAANAACGCNGGCEQNCGKVRQSCCQEACPAAETEATYSECCCCNRNCSGFGCHGGYSVCCDQEYYNRQYALCRCKCVCRCCKGNVR